MAGSKQVSGGRALSHTAEVKTNAVKTTPVRHNKKASKMTENDKKNATANKTPEALLSTRPSVYIVVVPVQRPGVRVCRAPPVPLTSACLGSWKGQQQFERKFSTAQHSGSSSCTLLRSARAQAKNAPLRQNHDR